MFAVRFKQLKCVETILSFGVDFMLKNNVILVTNALWCYLSQQFSLGKQHMI